MLLFLVELLTTRLKTTPVIISLSQPRLQLKPELKPELRTGV